MTKQKVTTTNKQKIDLNTVLNPHPLMLAEYEKNQAIELFTDFEALRPQYVLEDRLFKIQKMSGAPIRHHFGSLYRKVVDGKKEYIIGFEHLSTSDFYHNPVDHTREIGRIQIPSIVNRFSLPSTIRSDVGKLEAKSMPPEISGFSTQYLYEFSTMVEQLQDWYSKDHYITDQTHFYYWNEEGKIAVSSFDDFIHMDGSDLILLAKSKHKLSGVFRSEERAQMLESLRQQIKEEMKDSGFFTGKK